MYLLEDQNIQRSTGVRRIGTSLGQYFTDTDVDGINTVPINLAKENSILSSHFINQQTLTNILKVVMVNGAQNAKNETKLFIISFKMVQREITCVIFMGT